MKMATTSKELKKLIDNQVGHIIDSIHRGTMSEKTVAHLEGMIEAYINIVEYLEIVEIKEFN